MSLKDFIEHHQLKMQEMRQAKKEDLIRALGQDVYEELDKAYQQGGVRSLMDKIPELFMRDDDPLAVRYLSIYEVFRHRKGRCGEEAHLAFGVLYLFNIKPIEMVISTADHVWLIVRGLHYDPGITGEDRYDKTFYSREWKGASFGFMLALNIDGNVRDVTAEYIEMTQKVMERRKKIMAAE